MDDRSRSLAARLFATRVNTAIVPTYDTAFTPNAKPAPNAATTAPAMTGPTALAKAADTELSATVEVSMDRGTRSGKSECQPGRSKATPNPSASPHPRRMLGVIQSRTMNRAMVAAMSPIPVCVTRTTDALSNRSASTPAGRAKTSRGRLREAAIQPTQIGEAVSSHINQDPAVI